MSRWTKALAALLIAALVVSLVGVWVVVFVDGFRDDGQASPTPGSTIEPAPLPRDSVDARVAPDPALERFYAQEIAWEGCGDNDCGELEVPLDYANPAGETIRLALLRVPAGGQAIASMVVNPGGPGAPGTSYAEAAGRVFREPLLQHFDIVGFDPRGTGDSSPVDCLSDEVLDDFLASDPDPDTPAEKKEFIEWSDRLADGCAERSGALASHVSTEEAARDIDVLRSALGDAQLTYFGASYGTKLGATYADLFPERAGRLVLDGAVDVSLPSRELSLGQAEGFETALRAYVQNCIDVSRSCFLGETVDQGLGRISAFLDQVDAEPLSTNTNRDLEVGNAFYGIVVPLYSRDSWSFLSTALQQAFGGDGSVLLQLSDLYSSRGANGYTDNSAEAIYAINCLDDPYAIDASEVPAQIPAFEKASPTFGEVFAWGLTGCGGFDYPEPPPSPAVLAEGAAPIVVIGTTRDPATPYAWSVALAEQLDSGVLISRDGDGHTGYNSGNECVDLAVEDYLVAGVVPDDGLTC